MLQAQQVRKALQVLKEFRVHLGSQVLKDHLGSQVPRVYRAYRAPLDSQDQLGHRDHLGLRVQQVRRAFRGHQELRERRVHRVFRVHLG